jgi:primosomal protein N' (replication factor Y)
LTQVAGRAGRSALTGEVVIQTCQPRHETLAHVLGHDYLAFYRQEMAYREELSYPPFSRIALIEFRGAADEAVMRHAEAFAKLLRERKQSLAILGPAAAAIHKLKGSYRWHVVVKGIRSADPSGKRLHRLLQDTIAAFGRTSHGRDMSVRMTLDVDPQGMM